MDWYFAVLALGLVCLIACYVIWNVWDSDKLSDIDHLNLYVRRLQEDREREQRRIKKERLDWRRMHGKWMRNLIKKSIKEVENERRGKKV